MRVFDKLNTPRTVLILLLVILAVNGYLLYQQQHRSTSTTPTAGNTSPETTVSQEGPQLAKAEETTRNTPNKTTSGDEDSGENKEGDRTGTTSENETPKRGSSSGGSSGKAKEERAPSDRKDGSGPPELSLDGLAAAVRSCDGEAGSCVKGFVSKVAPKARYLGGRTDLASDSRGAEVLYFEAPQIEECDFERERYAPESGTEYTVILIGRGSFESERGSECIPTA